MNQYRIEQQALNVFHIINRFNRDQYHVATNAIDAVAICDALNGRL